MNTQANFNLKKSLNSFLSNTYECTKNQAGNLYGFTEEINSLEKKIKKLEEENGIDNLTQVNNRKYLDSKLNDLLEGSIRNPNNTNFALIYFDIDNFKKINDKFGHVTGDLVLKETAKIIKTTSRDSDVVCRYGGEEFAIILPNYTLNDAVVAANRYRNAIKKNYINKINGNITISLGIIDYELFIKHFLVTKETKIKETMEAMYKRVDFAMYEAKKNGKNRVETYNHKSYSQKSTHNKNN